MVLINRHFNTAETGSGAGSRAEPHYITVPKRLTIRAFNPEDTTQILQDHASTHNESNKPSDLGLANDRPHQPLLHQAGSTESHTDS